MESFAPSETKESGLKNEKAEALEAYTGQESFDRYLKRRSDLWHDISLVALSTGLRSGEIFNLPPEHINLSAKTVAVVDTKSDNRVVPLNSAALDIAETYFTRNMGSYFYIRK